MARIRTIKPEFWTDEKIVQLPYEARLLFIGMWNFADDYGCLSDEPERIKMQVLPSDPIDATIILDLLLSAGLVDRYMGEDGSSYLSLPHFLDHQKVDHPAKSKIIRESSRKFAIPNAARRDIAKRHGCLPGKEANAECYYCGAPGHIYWWNTTKGKPSAWVSFSLEIDHLVAEFNGGSTTSDNLVLACRECNRSKGTNDFMAFMSKSRESSRILAPEGKGMEGNGIIPTATEIVLADRSISEKSMRNCFEVYYSKLESLYPHANLPAEMETCIAHYAKHPVLDPYPVILKWMNRVKKERSLSLVSKQSEREQILADNAESCRQFAGGV